MIDDELSSGHHEGFTCIAVHTNRETLALNERIVELLRRAASHISRVLVSQLKNREPNLHPQQIRITRALAEYCKDHCKFILTGLYLGQCVRTACAEIVECVAQGSEIHIVLETVLDAEGQEEFDPRERPSRLHEVIEKYRALTAKQEYHPIIRMNGLPSGDEKSTSITVNFHQDIEGFLQYLNQ